MKQFLQRLIDENKRRFDARNQEIMRMMHEIECAETTIKRIETELGNPLRVDLQLEDRSHTPRPLYIGENFQAPYSTRLHDVVLSLGFVEVDRISATPGMYDHVVLAKDRVYLSLDTRPNYRLPAIAAENRQRRHSDKRVAA